ncbi:MAG: hypothetical protein NC321_07735 [Clostridium sp.]|nr:hypothetical protein [Clostridium sp.]
MIENFRYSSPWEQFEEAVRKLKDLIENEKAYWLVGYLREFDIYIDEIEKVKLGEDILEIVNSEILYLLYETLNGKDINEEKIEKTIRAVSEDASEKSVRDAVMSLRNKFEFVKDSFDIEKLRKRYKLKKESVSAKISGFNYNIYTSNLSDGDKMNCAFINISSKKRLAEMRDSITLFENDEKQTEVYFVCDKEDIDMLIHQLEIVKKKMEEC